MAAGAAPRPAGRDPRLWAASCPRWWLRAGRQGPAQGPVPLAGGRLKWPLRAAGGADGRPQERRSSPRRPSAPGPMATARQRPGGEARAARPPRRRCRSARPAGGQGLAGTARSCHHRHRWAVAADIRLVLSCRPARGAMRGVGVLVSARSSQQLMVVPRSARLRAGRARRSRGPGGMRASSMAASATAPPGLHTWTTGCIRRPTRRERRLT